MNLLSGYRDALRSTELVQRIGWVRRLQGLAIEAEGPQADLGEMCRVLPAGVEAAGPVLAEVVGLEQGRVVLLPYGPLRGIGAGSKVLALGHASRIGVGPGLVGRVIDGFGAALDGGPAPAAGGWADLHASATNPMERPRIARVLETGVRAIDVFLTLGEGQRMGIFAGSGVGKSSLLGMITRHARADLNVVALIGERGREVREFIEEQLGEEGLRRSVVVVATSEQPALARIRAAHAAVAIARHFAQQGRRVLLTMDSVTRLAMARREVGLAAGEPATARGYTPSVFAELPQICERCGTLPGGGSITALLTVLVEGDDLNEPVADSMRSILDGHVVLSRELAQQAHFPAIDLLRSASRLMKDLVPAPERQLVREAVRHLAVLERNRQLVELGAYAKGANPALDAALALEAPLFAWLRQESGGAPRAQALQQLGAILAQRSAP
ncbi:MAG TPA: FliI/YscN family ATPase [Ramlibacter sp.]|uniref:FliI/YscN family ATPase n=1 Tax=Ramlibacter sp. TaxID=1917967 RepID=UPI002D7F17E4|nr:FliI/YscN family ATPase [Ramlibacter sp.]HET8748747.1 FliI/YscN family ATPase [Ramlibacter sp.]